MATIGGVDPVVIAIILAVLVPLAARGAADTTLRCQLTQQATDLGRIDADLTRDRARSELVALESLEYLLAPLAARCATPGPTAPVARGRLRGPATPANGRRAA